MKFERIAHQVRCDVGICKHMADYTLTSEGTARGRQLNLCSECMHKLYEAIGREIIPKSPTNILSRGKSKNGQIL